MGNKKTKQSSSSTSTSSLTDWSKGMFESGQSGIMDTINNFNTDHPYQPYTGQMVADLSGNEQRARDYASANLGSNAGMFSDAEGAIRTGMAADWNPESVSYRTFDPSRIEARQNPYERNVVDAAGAYFDETRDKQMMDNQARATRTGAFGGSRHGVADGELMRTAAMDKAGMLADLKYKGWNDAVSADERESAGIFGADSFNANRNDQAAQWRADNQYKGAGMLSDLAGAKQNSWMQETNLMNQLGMDEREIENAKLLAERAKYDDKAAEEWKRMQLELQTRIGLLGATPLLTNNSATGSSTAKQSGIDFAGLMGGAGGLFGGLGSLFKGG